MTAQVCFDDHQDKAEGVPEGHDFAEEAAEEAEGFGLGLVVELPDDGIDEEGDCELSADHKADAEDGDDVEEMHAFVAPCWCW